MYITLHCGGMPFNGETLKYKSLGGSETAAYYLARELARDGHRVTLFTNSKDAGKYEGVNYQWAGDLTENCPLGDRFTYYAENTPTDILIIQRHPDAWRHDWMAKVKLWWLHDLALVRNKQRVGKCMWNCDGVIAVSEYHKDQICETYSIDPEFIHVIRNGVDLELFDRTLVLEKRRDEYRMVYCSRPERGLEHHVRPGGIMERLADEAPNARLYVCMYDNVAPQMRDYYKALWQRCEELPNVVNMGCLRKQQLYAHMKSANAVVYPTEFEEVSCITAMEAAAAGIPFISSKHAALPETCQDGGAILFPLNDGEAWEDAFVKRIVAASKHPDIDSSYCSAQRKKAAEYSWTGRGKDVIEVFKKIQGKAANNTNIAKHFMRMSDMYALIHLFGDNHFANSLQLSVDDELLECYSFMASDDWQAHYDRYYEHEKEKGVNYGPEDPSGQNRYEHVLSLVRELPPGSRVMDYGCAHGHYTNNLAKQCPELEFVGVEIAQSNVDKAKEWAPENATFMQGQLCESMLGNSLGEPLEVGEFDVILAAEVIEHLEDYRGVVDGLCGYLKDGGVFIATTPYGPWESAGYRREWPWRAHVHHFERADLAECFGHHPEFTVTVAPFCGGYDGKGSYIWSFRKPKEASRYIDYDRKIRETVPRQTVSACIIVKDGEGSLRNLLLNLRDVVDEVCIGVDASTTDDTTGVIERFSRESHGYPVVVARGIEPATKTGFDEARNRTLEMASGDWILWADADEVFSYPERIQKYLRNNMFSGYAVKQHHISAEPLGVMKTDIPVRLFRNDGIRFYGRVHEHPERELNEGVGRVTMIHDADLMHHGYINERVRRERFWRNISLMAQDREDYPDRVLGKFLWLRDLCQMCQYELEANGGCMSHGIMERINQGISLFIELVENGEVRYVLDGLQFYTPLVRLTQTGFNASFAVAVDPFGQVDSENVHVHNATFYNREHFEKVTGLLYDTALKDSEQKYL